MKKRSCGRPFSPYINIRAGGLDGKRASVVPCCYVLGQDSRAVLGTVSESSIREIWEGEAYTRLRELHQQERFDEIDYCRDCDQLYESPESLVWSNIPGKEYGQFKNRKDLDFRTYTTAEA